VEGGERRGKLSFELSKGGSRERNGHSRDKQLVDIGEKKFYLKKLGGGKSSAYREK